MTAFTVLVLLALFVFFPDGGDRAHAPGDDRGAAGQVPASFESGASHPDSLCRPDPLPTRDARTGYGHPQPECITKDNIQVEVDGLVYLKVMDPKTASYGIGNYKVASINLAQTTMRAEVGKLALSQTFSEREQLNETIVKEIDKASDSWGIKVLRYEIMNIIPSPGVVNTLEKQMEAEREKTGRDHPGPSPERVHDQHLGGAAAGSHQPLGGRKAKAHQRGKRARPRDFHPGRGHGPGDPDGRPGGQRTRRAGGRQDAAGRILPGRTGQDHEPRSPTSRSCRPISPTSNRCWKAFRWAPEKRPARLRPGKGGKP